MLAEAVSTIDGGDQPLSPPKTERCSNCSGAGKVGYLKLLITRRLLFMPVMLHMIPIFCLITRSEQRLHDVHQGWKTESSFAL